jgi:hypothetical protein
MKRGNGSPRTGERGGQWELLSLDEGEGMFP